MSSLKVLSVRASLRLLLLGYLYGITSERRLLEEVRMHLAYRWFSRLGFEKEIPDHSTFSMGVRPQNLAADKAYGSGEFLAWLLARDIQPHIPVIDRQHQTRGLFTRDAFRYEPKENAYYCPEGKPLHYRGQRRSSGGDLYRSTEAQCRGCPQKKSCTAGSYRRLFLHWQEPARQTVRALASTPDYKRSQ